MKRFVLTALAFSGVAFSLLGMLACVCFLVRDEWASDSIGMELNRKLARAESLRSPKLLLVGGSGCSHGINSTMLEEALRMPVVNTGVSAALGLAYQLTTVSPFVHDGDWVVILPEYPNFTDCLGDGSVLETVCDIRPSDRRLLDMAQWCRLVPHMPRLGIKKLGRLIKSCVVSRKPKSDNTYDGWTYDERGDMISAWNDMRNLGFSSGGSKNVREIPADLGQECVSRIKAFAEKHPQAHVILVPPALQDAAFDRDLLYIRAVERVLGENGTPFVASAKRYRMDNADCWDSVYHLNGSGIQKRTKMLIEDLRSWICHTP